MRPFICPTKAELSFVASKCYKWDSQLVGEVLGHLGTFINPEEVMPGDYIEADRWLMVTLYNVNGLGEIFVADPNRDDWHHTWRLFDRGVKVRHLSRALVDEGMTQQAKRQGHEEALR